MATDETATDVAGAVAGLFLGRKPTTGASQRHRKEGGMATSTKKEGGKKGGGGGGRKAQPVLSLTEAKKVMAANLDAYTAYEKARLALKAEGVSAADKKKLEATMAKNREGFTLYWRQYNNPNVAAARTKEREERKAKNEADAKAKAEAKAKKEADKAAAAAAAPGGEA